LAQADEVVLTDIYPASEEPIPGVTVEALAAAMNTARSVPVRVVKGVEHVAAALAALAVPGDLLITMGAGSIGTVAAQVVDELRQRFGVEETTGKDVQ
jgi:UDP-N-acetylmuramate--alanine ligase